MGLASGMHHRSVSGRRTSYSSGARCGAFPILLAHSAVGTIVATLITGALIAWLPLQGLWAEMFSLVLRLTVAVLFDGIIACWLLATLAVCVRRADAGYATAEGGPDDSQPRTVERHSAQSRLLHGLLPPDARVPGSPESADVRVLSISFVDKDDVDTSASPANTSTSPSLSQSGTRLLASLSTKTCSISCSKVADELGPCFTSTDSGCSTMGCYGAGECPSGLRGHLTKQFGSRRKNDLRRNRLMRRESLQRIVPCPLN